MEDTDDKLINKAVDYKAIARLMQRLNTLYGDGGTLTDQQIKDGVFSLPREHLHKLQQIKEHFDYIRNMSVLLFTTLAISTFTYLNRSSLGLPQEQLPWYLTSAFICVSGKIADTFSSMRIVKADVKQSLKENSVFLPDNPTVKQFTSIKQTAVDAIFMTLGIVVPPLGITFGAASYLAAKRNERLEKQLGM